MRKQYLKVVFVVTLIVATAGCIGALTGDEVDMEVSEILENTQSTMENVETHTTTETVRTEMTFTEFEDPSGQLDDDEITFLFVQENVAGQYDLANEQYHRQGMADFESAFLGEDQLVVDEYLVNGTIYNYDVDMMTGEGQWLKSPSTFNDSAEYYVEDFVAYEDAFDAEMDGDDYVLTIDFTDEEVVDALAAGIDDEIFDGADVEEMTEHVDDFYVKYYIDSDTFRMTKFEMNMYWEFDEEELAELEGGEPQEEFEGFFEIDIEIIFDNYGAPVDIELPDAAKNASETSGGNGL